MMAAHVVVSFLGALFFEQVLLGGVMRWSGMVSSTSKTMILGGVAHGVLALDL
jgi:hypothetical protein